MSKTSAFGMAVLLLSLLASGRAKAQDPSYAPPESQQPPEVQQGPTGPQSQGSYGRPPQAPSEQQPPNGPQTQQNTDAGVARASFIHGDVSMQRGDNNDVSAVVLNTPLMSADKILTGNDSRTELQLDYANVLRLDSNAEANLTTLTRSRIQVQISQGLANYSVMKGSEADVEIDTPNVSVRPLHEGRYRIEVNADGDTMVSVREGDADISTPQGGTQVHKGQLITIRGSANDAQYKVTDGPNLDDWDKWNKDRDGIIYDAQSYQHTSRYYTGAGDLDGYGTWSEVPDYGPVWVPTVSPGWAPYRMGRWVYEPYYGWTWVSEEPWGWAPYHYGRWLVYGGSWAWWPGPVYGGYRPIWAPAYVSFFGFGRGIGVGVGFGFGGGFGSIGWLPIGPGDYFHPWWGGFGGRFGVVDIHNVNNLRNGIGPLHAGDRFSNLRGVVSNDRLRAGISGVPAGNFGRNGGAARAVSASEFGSGRMMTGSLPVTPSRESMRASDRPVSATAAARFNGQQGFSGRGTAAADGRGFQGQARQGQSVQGQSSQSSQGWNRFDSRQTSASQPSGRTQQQGARQNGGGTQGAAQGQGWQRFSSQPGGQSSARGNAGASASNRGQSASSYRPPLDMSKPIVNQRSYGAGSYSGANNAGSAKGGYRGGYSAAPAYRPPSSYQGGAVSPAYRGGGSTQYAAPGYRSAPSPSYRSAPSAPSYRGGGAPSRGSAAPSGGRSSSSGRSSGGGGRSSGRR